VPLFALSDNVSGVAETAAFPGSSSDRRFAVAKVRIVVEVLLARIPLRADTGAGVAGALGSFGAGIRINELREVVVPSRTVTWQTKV
jgi:hypothetical protein